MNEPRLRHVQCLDSRGLHRMAYWDWGDPGAERVLVCAHGLSRQGRDFDTLARALQSEVRVVCPDVVGRGESDWLVDPAGYQIPAYVADMVTLLARLDAKSVHWLGTSMGGLIGMALAGLPGSPIERLVLNDVGPAIDAAGIARIASYVGAPLTWGSADEAADYLLTISQGFGPHSRDEWMALTEPMLRRSEASVRLHYDPAIAVSLRQITPQAAAAGEAALWAAYDAIRCPTLLLRGATSDVLSRDTAAAMTQRGPRARLHEFAGVGHAPTLVEPSQVAVVREFLLGP
ncbi:MAG TPA: alpha/beta hydrolase [Caldimonas sp.]|jgi:pimeloyl-ACP methyl ester carboxylesterase|nr:alpha/beta hydrolase [Caldimonas sp.]HEX2541734.1 alpha/beta hydrolase [Caldimonas sp.]